MDRGAHRSQSEVLSAALRAIRTRRGLRTTEVADAMGMALRSYEHFEAGGGRTNLARIHKFAAATDSDPYAILAALAFGEPDFAIRAADNKLMTIIMVSVQELHDDMGEALTELDARTLINTVQKAFAELRQQSVRRDVAVQAWFDAREPRLIRPDLEDPPPPDDATPP